LSNQGSSSVERDVDLWTRAVNQMLSRQFLQHVLSFVRVLRLDALQRLFGDETLAEIEIDASAETIDTLMRDVEFESPEDRKILGDARQRVKDEAAETKQVVPNIAVTAVGAVPTLLMTGAVVAQALGINLPVIGDSSGPSAYTKPPPGGSSDGFSPRPGAARL
jgi:hypothetical protein